MGIYFYRIPNPSVFEIIENFEYSAGWPGTFDVLKTEFSSSIISESFEPEDGWT